MRLITDIASHTRYIPLLILTSLALSVWRYQPLNGSLLALILTVLLQFYLSGYLLARALGRHSAAHPIARFTWILVCAFSLNVVLGGAARLAQVPIPVYVILLHGVMLALALVRPSPPEHDEPPWRLSWQNAPLVALVLLCCGVALFVGVERNRFRFNGYEDQTVFVELADWLAHDPDDPGRRSRRIGVEVGDTRWDTDGWTYTHAAWVWTSGVPAAELIWYRLTPLFIWTVPLAVFGMAYELTRREETAAWTAAALTIAGLLTLDSLVYVPTSLAFGQFSLFQINTLRTIATALMTPLALLTIFAYLQQPSRRQLALIVLAGLALAALHPRQIAILLCTSGATAALWWLAQPSRRRLLQVALLGLALASVMLLPYWQRSTRPLLASTTTRQENRQLEADENNEQSAGGARGVILPLRDLPILGASYIVDPSIVFYHPMIMLAAALGLLAVIRWRASLAAQYVLGSTAATLIVLFTPGVTPLVARLITLTLISGMVFGLPIALTFGLTTDSLFTVASRVRPIQTVRRWVGALVAAAVMLALLFEPFPIPASARDQIRASNLLQSTRDMQPFDAALVASLLELLPKDRRSVLIVPTLTSNYVVESVPRTLITGGRASGNVVSTETRRFLTESGKPMPWLDSSDLAFITEWGVTHVVLEADDTRLTQLLLQPEHFELLDTPAGFFVFRVADSLAPTPANDLFERMNMLYAEQGLMRWGRGGFALTQPGSQDGWADIAAAWERLPDNDETRLGLAFTLTLMGDDRRALPLWQTLHTAHPDATLFIDALAHMQIVLGSPADALQPLLAALDSPQPTTRVQAVKTLLTEDFYYLLDARQMQTALAIVEQDALVWHQLALFNNADNVRRRVVLMLSANQLDVALRWSNALPEVEVDPRDLLTRAAILLAQGNSDGALSILRSSTDADWNAANIALHPDRWQNNSAAFAYACLSNASACETSAAGEIVSLLTIAEQRALYVMQPEVTQDDDAHTLTVTATFGSPHVHPYPVRTWRVQVASPDASAFYASTLAEAIDLPGVLVRVPISVMLPADLPPLTPARVFITPMYDNRVTFGQTAVDVVLNRPADVQPNADAQPVAAQFGDSIWLESCAADVTDDTLTLKLYWRADSPQLENYQIFVHVVNTAGETAAQRDSAPVDGRYPTSHWRLNTFIEDTHIIPFQTPLPPGEYRVVVGMYRLPDGTRLTITPDDDRVTDNSILLYRFSLP